MAVRHLFLSRLFIKTFVLNSSKMYYKMVYLIIFSIVLQGMISLAGAAYLYCLGASRDQFDKAELSNASTLLSSSFYNFTLRNIVFISGANGSYYGNASKSVLDSMKAAGNMNVFYLDWSKEASIGNTFGQAQIIATYGFITIPNAYSVAIQLAKALLDMSHNNFRLNDTHLVGHSLGAHLAGCAGKTIIDAGNGKILDRITGLDPAGPIFNSSFGLLQVLDKNCASFVDVIHTDSQQYGFNKSLGSVDIWVNRIYFLSGSKDQHVQPGCLNGTFPYFDPKGLCSHDRSWMLDVEARLHDTLLASGPAANYYVWTAGNSTTVIYLGPKIDRSARGDFYLITNAQPLYGKGPAGLNV